MPTRTYLGTDLTPREYYRLHHKGYNNPHSPGIRYVLNKLMHYLSGTVLDLGCGNGLASLILWSYAGDIIGVDSEQAMIDRYHDETNRSGVVQEYWDELPRAKSAIFCYSLHLCEESRVAQVGYRLIEAGITKVIVISPLKARREDWANFELVEETADKVGPNHKTVYGRVYAYIAPK